MKKISIGAGGWGYFIVPDMNALEVYSEAFDFVEVNSTFYEIPNLNVVKNWKHRVPDNFEFSVKCHQDITHTNKMDNIEKTCNTFKTMIKICNILNSRFLILETPASINFDKMKIEHLAFLMGKTREEVADMLKSNEVIEINLKETKQREVKDSGKIEVIQ